MSARPIPRATYRVQLGADFGFAAAARLVPYLAQLGISHCYASPYLHARSGSTHGYDIVDHNALHPQIGDWESFAQFADALRAHGMGHILDLVPNHMGVWGDDNLWWLDVLENGEASAYAAWFDIDWHPVKEEMRGKVLAPLLGDHYGTVLASGALRVEFDAAAGTFDLRYEHHRLPVDPQTYPELLAPGGDRLANALGDEAVLAEFHSLTDAFGNLPARHEPGDAQREARRRDKEIHKRRLAELCARTPALEAHVRANTESFNGVAGDAASFHALHRLLERQAYRLAYWRVALDEINYRRFFDINDLAGLRMENPEVFDATHRLVLELVAAGKIAGLRIDHPDGLYDPAGYCRRLVGALHEAVGARDDDAAPPCYLVVEKILAAHERLPEDWPVHGTTGYEFGNLVHGLLIHPDAERALTRLYARYIGRRTVFDDLLYERKKLIVRTQLSSELTVLANLIDAIAESDPLTRDYTLNGLREALTEVVACFPVYRTYVGTEQVTDDDRRDVEWALAQARRRSPAADVSIYDFVRDLLLLEGRAAHDAGYRARAARFAMKFQQYTAPVMAKALEDTAFYIYNRFVSLNDVGGDPRRFAASVSAFHHAGQERARRWPHGMLTTSTHDSKRSEDVRARLAVLSEIPEEWRHHVGRWSRLNRRRRVLIDGAPAPDRNDEYLLYQTLLGAWPLAPLDAAGLEAFGARIEAYMLKAIREAKVHTSWINPNPAYEEAVARFVRALLRAPSRNPFLTDFLTLHGRVARYGLLNGLTQTLLKLSSPGVPDLYQGSELWQFDLVDPDNRHPVDYERRRAWLQELRTRVQGGEPRARVARGLLDTLEDGRAKLYLIWTALSLRGALPELYAAGGYRPLAVEGPHAEHLCAFARAHGSDTLVTVAPRWFARLPADAAGLPLGEAAWRDTWVEAPEAGALRSALTDAAPAPHVRDGRRWLAAAELMRDFPVALLHAGA